MTLFDRAGRKPELTDAGRMLLADARAILIKSMPCGPRREALQRGVEPTLSMAVDPIVPIGSVSTALEDVRVVFPSIGVILQTKPAAVRTA